MSWTQPYRWLLIVHVLLGIGAFGPLLTMPFLTRRALASGFGATGSAAVGDSALWVRRRVTEPCFAGVGVVGLLVAWAHPDDAIFSHLWVRLAVPFWIIAVSVVLAVQGPLARRAATVARRLANGSAAAGDGAALAQLTRWLELVTMVSAVGLPVMVFLMVFQPT